MCSAWESDIDSRRSSSVSPSTMARWRAWRLEVIAWRSDWLWFAGMERFLGAGSCVGLVLPLGLELALDAEARAWLSASPPPTAQPVAAQIGSATTNVAVAQRMRGIGGSLSQGA